MGPDGFPEEFDPTRCTLFLGAGFSADAKNKIGKNPPTADGLNASIKKMAGIPENDPSHLIDVAGYAISKNFNLFKLLESLYTIKEINNCQRKILTQPWWRIYTTNYDNAVSVFLAESGCNATQDVFDIMDDAPRQLRKGAVIHLHGSIAKCQPDKLEQSLILTRRSYVEQRVKKSPWWEWFDRDIKTSQYVFFLGYDLNDFEPATYLMKYPDLRKRCHFILRNTESPIASSKILDYGVRHSFELKGFEERLSRAKVAPAPAHPSELRAFQYIDISKDKKIPPKPTSAEIQELFSFGTLRFDGIRATFPESEYVVFRKKALESCEKALDENTTIVIHGKIGNGKSIVCDQLKIKLSQENFRCFVLKGSNTPIQQDIEYLKLLGSVAIFFPNYDSAIANIHLFSGMPESTRYFVELPTSVLQVRMQEVTSKLKGKVAKIGVDKLEKSDILALKYLLRRAGLTRLEQTLDIREGIEFREFLLMAYDEPEVAKRLRTVIDPLLRNPQAKEIICASAIFKVTGVAVDTAFIENATGIDPYSALSELGDGTLEIMEYSLYKIEPHSSILSEHLLKKYIEPKYFLNSLFNLAVEAARRINSTKDFSSERFRKARSLLSAVLQFGFIGSIIGRSADKRALAGKMYELCRYNELINKEPLFWLQYSIFWQDHPRWDLAESHMIEAYSRGTMLPGFKTYQIDTNYLGLLCDLEINSDNMGEISRFDKLIELIEKCRLMIDDGNHRDHVIKAFLKLEPMVFKRKNDFTETQAVTLVYNVNLTIKKLVNLTSNEKALWGTETCRKSLERSVSILITRNQY